MRRATSQPCCTDTTSAISIHALLAESDWGKIKWCCSIRDFYPRSPCGERPIIFCKLLDRSVISIHALLAESDALGAVTSPAVSRFLSTLSLRRATKQKRTILVMEDISIHALLAESDPLELMTVLIIYDFYPRSPCGERPERLFQIIRILGFLSTLSLRRATEKSTPEEA